MSIKLGDKARDRITGFEGVVVARTEWISGCTRTTLQPTMGADGKLPDAQTFDEPMLELTGATWVPPGPRNKGGPRPAPTQSAAPR